MIYSVKRFSSDDQENKKKGMGTGMKLALGAAGVAAAFGGAKAGWMGAGLQRQTNKLWGNIGSAVGSRGMMSSGYSGVTKANYKSALKDISKSSNTKVADLTKAQKAQAARTAAQKTRGDFSSDFLKNKQEAQNKFIESKMKAKQAADAAKEAARVNTGNVSSIAPGQTLPEGINYVYS